MKTLNTIIFLLVFVVNSHAGNTWVLKGQEDVEFDGIVEESFDNPKKVFTDTEQPPNWVLGRPHPRFPVSKYVVGVGFSEKSTVSASESARAELIKSIRVQVNSTINDYHSTDKSFSEASITTETDFLLEGSQMKDGWYDLKNDIYYSLVVIERKYVLSTVQEHIDNIVSSTSLSIRQGDTYYNNDHIIKALVHYYDGYLQSIKLVPYIQTYKSVSMLKHKPVVEQDYTLIFKEKIQNIIGNIEVFENRQVLNDSDVKYLVKTTFKDKPISGFPCEFNGSHGFVEKVLSNEEGICESNYHIRNKTKKHNYVMKAMVDMPAFKKHFNHTLKKDLFGRLELIDVMFRTPYSPKPIMIAKNTQPKPQPERKYVQETREQTMIRQEKEQQMQFNRDLERSRRALRREHSRMYPRHYQRFDRNNQDLNWDIYGNSDGNWNLRMERNW